MTHNILKVYNKIKQDFLISVYADICHGSQWNLIQIIQFDQQYSYIITKSYFTAQREIKFKKKRQKNCRTGNIRT